MSALQAFLASRPGLANFNLPASPGKANTEPQTGGATSDAAPAGGDPVASAGDAVPAGGDPVPAGGDPAPAASPILAYAVDPVESIFTPSRYTLYPTTPTLSVDAVQARFICEAEIAVAVSEVGTVGAWVSAESAVYSYAPRSGALPK